MNSESFDNAPVRESAVGGYRLFRDASGPRICAAGSVVCIGAFDGLHLGHRALILHTVARARALGVPAVALSFEPLPREFFARGEVPPRLLLARAKLEGLWWQGIDLVGLLRFNAALAAWSPQEFIDRVLIERLGAREVWVGPGFRFGKNRAGDLATLRAAGAMVAEQIAPVLLDGEPVSSTRIRQALGEGDFATAARLLGTAYAISGRVVRGQQLGRKLGFPTANLRFGNRTPALRGIYATRVHVIESGSSAKKPSQASAWPSVSSFGTRPTIDGTEPVLEAHLFDFNGDLYQQRIKIEFVAKLRDEEKFPDLPTLVAQMRRDANWARRVLGDELDPTRLSMDFSYARP